MNPLVYLLLSSCVLALIAMAWIAVAPLEEEESEDRSSRIEDLVPLHTQHFPQLKQSLDSADKQYISSKLSRDQEQMWKEERDGILRIYLSGLAGDFGRVMRMGRLVDQLNPSSAKSSVFQRTRLATHFRLRYRILALWISCGGPMRMEHVRRLTESVGNLSALIEALMPNVEFGEKEAETPRNLNA